MKGTMTMKRPDAQFIFIAGAMLTLFPGPRLAAATHDLKADWSDSANPNGPWAYKEGNNLLPHVNAWQSGDFATAQPAWARAGSGNTIIPAWFKSSGTLGSPSHYDCLEGDIVIHTADDANGVGSGLGNVTWTSPLEGGNDWKSPDKFGNQSEP